MTGLSKYTSDAIQKALSNCAQVREALNGRTLAGLINNAGVAWPAPLLHQSLADFKNVLDANLCGTFIVTKVTNILKDPQ